MFLAARRVGYCVLLSVGWKGREEDIMHLKIDDEEREDLIKEFGYVKVTKPGGTEQ